MKAEVNGVMRCVLTSLFLYLFRVIFLNQSSVEMVNFKSVKRNQSKNEIFLNRIQSIKADYLEIEIDWFIKMNLYQKK